MFEQEAKERARKLKESQTLGVYDDDEDLARDSGWNDGEVAGYEQGFEEGAEFGYNKANEWHYVKDEDLPKEDKKYWILTSNGEPKVDNWLGISWVNSYDVIAWKEIVLPELKEGE